MVTMTTSKATLTLPLACADNLPEIEWFISRDAARGRLLASMMPYQLIRVKKWLLVLRMEQNVPKLEQKKQFIFPAVNLHGDMVHQGYKLRLICPHRRCGPIGNSAFMIKA